MKFGLTPKHLETIATTLLIPLENAGIKVWFFGSRARGDFKTFSDLDVLYEGKDIPLSLIGSITEDLEESSLPIKIDLVNINDLAESYKESVLRDRIEIRSTEILN